MTTPISFVPAATGSTGTSAADSAASLSDNFDTFLNILTAQIQNQDPLEPMDSSQFTQQLVQFSGVEQQIKSNASLETLIASSNASTGAALSGYLGQEAEIDSAGAAFTGEPVHWRYYLPADAASTTVTVTDAKGKVLYSQAGDLETGGHDFVWDGSLNGGGSAPTDTPYWLSVVAEDANGTAITPAHTVVTTVSGVDLSYGTPAITTSAGVFTYADIIRLSRQ
jgi:flagellar basal-body rod modification protein FlgD